MTKEPDPEMLRKLAEVLDVSVDYLLNGHKASVHDFETLAAHRTDDPLNELPKERRSLEEFQEYILRKYGKKRLTDLLLRPRGAGFAYFRAFDIFRHIANGQMLCRWSCFSFGTGGIIIEWWILNPAGSCLLGGPGLPPVIGLANSSTMHPGRISGVLAEIDTTSQLWVAGFAHLFPLPGPHGGGPSEYRALRWAAQWLIPLDKLAQAFKWGILRCGSWQSISM